MTSPIQTLIKLMVQLRDPDNGCPWDKAQTYESIIPFTVEETYEVADAIERKDLAALKDELGDLLFQVIFLSRIAEEQGAFKFDDVAQAICDKLVRRHPHVFGDELHTSPEAVVHAWEGLKAKERADKRARSDVATDAAPSALDDIATALPAMMRARKLQSRAARIGFDWPSAEPVLDKIEEEVAELREAVEKKDSAALQAEFGDVLFSCANFARHAKIDPEWALRGANQRFEARFKHMEDAAREGGRQLLELTTAELDSLWQAAKQFDRSS